MDMLSAQQFSLLARTQFAEIPLELKEYILSAEFDHTISGIADFYSLDENVRNELNNEVTLVLLGLAPILDLERRIMPLVNNERIRARMVTEEIFDQVLEERIGLVPASLSPSAQDLFAALEAASVTEAVDTPAPVSPAPIDAQSVPRPRPAPAPAAPMPQTSARPQHPAPAPHDIPPPAPTPVAARAPIAPQTVSTASGWKSQNSLKGAHTMKSDIDALRAKGNRDARFDTPPAVPRYAKPLTDLPKYEEKS